MKLPIPARTIVSILVAATMAGCPAPKKSDSDGTGSTPTPVDQPAPAASQSVPRGENHLEGFDADVLQFTDQGSGFFPMSVVRALNDSKTGRPYLENLERFGLVPGEKSKRNPEGFPVGIVTNIITNEGDGREIEMFGFTCAACHTSDIRYNGKTVRVDGGSGLFYVDELGDQIGLSLKATLNNPDELLAFLRRYARESKLPEEQLAALDKIATWEKTSTLGKVLRTHLQEGGKDLLTRVNGQRTAATPPEPHESFLQRVKQLPEANALLGDLLGEEKSLAEKMLPELAKVMNDFENVIYRLKFLKTRDWLSSDPAHRLAAGYGRADDFGTARVELFGEWNPKNMLSVNAPVSVPPVWNVNKLAWLHWNANTNSVIQRSIGEALGVGATFNGENGETSVAIEKQMKIEEQIHKLTPPIWPDALFGKPDAVKVGRGRELYVANCGKCHNPDKVDEKGLVVFRLSTLDEAGTDPQDATNFDRPVYKQDGSTVGFADSIRDLLNLLQGKAKAAMSPESQALMDRLEIKQSPAKWRDTMTVTGGPVYPARPLEGIWATAPYLHNGSVPTLFDLLLPAAQRPKKFLVGQKDFDPVRVGFETNPDKITGQPGLEPFELDTTVNGNLNTGHEYGTELPEEDRMAIIEYLKVHRDSWPAQ